MGPHEQGAARRYDMGQEAPAAHILVLLPFQLPSASKSGTVGQPCEQILSHSHYPPWIPPLSAYVYFQASRLHPATLEFALAWHSGHLSPHRHHRCPPSPLAPYRLHESPVPHRPQLPPTLLQKNREGYSSPPLSHSPLHQPLWLLTGSPPPALLQDHPVPVWLLPHRCPSPAGQQQAS